jgi:hypothetical protein
LARKAIANGQSRIVETVPAREFIDREETEIAVDLEEDVVGRVVRYAHRARRTRGDLCLGHHSRVSLALADDDGNAREAEERLPRLLDQLALAQHFVNFDFEPFYLD